VMQDTLRSAATASVPFFDHAAIIRMLDDIPHIQDPILRGKISAGCLTVLSVCVLHERYHL